MERFESFCGKIQKMLADEKAVSRKIENGRELVSELLVRPDWFFDYLKKMILEPSSFESRSPGIWPNEYTLYRSPDRSFVVHAYIWDAKLADIIHDRQIIDSVTSSLLLLIAAHAASPSAAW